MLLPFSLTEKIRKAPFWFINFYDFMFCNNGIYVPKLFIWYPLSLSRSEFGMKFQDLSIQFLNGSKHWIYHVVFLSCGFTSTICCIYHEFLHKKISAISKRIIFCPSLRVLFCYLCVSKTKSYCWCKECLTSYIYIWN